MSYEFLFTFTARGSLVVLVEDDDEEEAFVIAKDAVESASSGASFIRDFQIDQKPDIYLEVRELEE